MRDYSHWLSIYHLIISVPPPAPFVILAESTLQSERNQGRKHVQASRNTYGWLDKLTSLTLPDGGTATHTYWPDGQLAAIRSNDTPVVSSPSSRSSSESFLWDNLALLKRNDTIYIIESHPSGGIPIASHPVGKPEEITYHLNDLLGTTLATVGPAGVSFSRLTSFGQPLKSNSSGGSLGTDAPSSPANPVPRNNQLPPTKR